jgi:VanZ family protein
MGHGRFFRVRRLARKVMLLIAFMIIILSVVPASARPVMASHNLEHTAIYLLLGLSAGISYLPRGTVGLCGALLLFCAAIEVLQLGIPGRHARFEDFVVDLLASLIGLAFAAVVFKIESPKIND